MVVFCSLTGLCIAVLVLSAKVISAAPAQAEKCTSLPCNRIEIFSRQMVLQTLSLADTPGLAICCFLESTAPSGCLWVTTGHCINWVLLTLNKILQLQGFF